VSAPGTACIHDYADFVRIEIETALHASATTVIPVLIGDTAMPQAGDIPKSIHALLKCHAFRLRADPHFQTDLNELTAHLEVVPEMAPDEMSMFDMFTTQIDWNAMDKERRATLNLVFGALLSCVEDRDLNTDKTCVDFIGHFGRAAFVSSTREIGTALRDVNGRVGADGAGDRERRGSALTLGGYRVAVTNLGRKGAMRCIFSNICFWSASSPSEPTCCAG
jgi:hypothetical protein